MAETGNNELTNKSLLMVIKSKKITSRHKGWMVTEGGACLVKVSKERVFLRGSDIYAEILRMRRASHGNGLERVV